MKKKIGFFERLFKKKEQGLQLDLSKYIITRLFHYTSWVKNDFASYNPTWYSKPIGDPNVKTIFYHFLNIANTYYRKFTEHKWSTLDQNKMVIEIQNVETGEFLYLGKYDDIYKIGKDFGTENKHCTHFGYSGYKKL